MCGISGFLDRTGNESAAVGQTILKMLNALDCRGPDSAGVALYGGGRNGDLVLRISLGENGAFDERAAQVSQRVQTSGSVRDASTTAEYMRLVVEDQEDARQLERLVESAGEGIEVVSMGHRLEIVKQVGSPQNLDATYGVSAFTGTHGIGHTRLSTESRIDLSHSQPSGRTAIPIWRLCTTGISPTITRCVGGTNSGASGFTPRTTPRLSVCTSPIVCLRRWD